MHAPGLDRPALAAFGRALRDVSAWRGRHIGPRLRELIILHVSSVNGCPVCSAMHGVWARSVGVQKADITAARGCEPKPEDFDARTELALRYAEARTLRREDREPETVRRFEQAFDADEQREVRAVIDLFTFNNRVNNSWERWVPGAQRRRERLGLCEPAAG